MDLFWLAIVAGIILVIIIYKSANSAQRTVPAREKKSIQSKAYHLEDSESFKWSVSSIPAGMSFRLSADVSITLFGTDSAVNEIHHYLRASSDLHYPERALRLALMMSRLNVEAPEIEAWRTSLIRKVKQRARMKISRQSNEHSSQASDPDLAQEVLELTELEEYEKLDERPSSWRNLDELSISRPEKLSDDDPFLIYIKNDINVLSAFNQVWAHPGSAIRLNDRGFVEWWIPGPARCAVPERQKSNRITAIAST